jgi:hypothetical protein
LQRFRGGQFCSPLQQRRVRGDFEEEPVSEILNQATNDAIQIWRRGTFLPLVKVQGRTALFSPLAKAG